MRAVRVRPAVVTSIVPRDVNIVLERDNDRFDLIVATNVLVYYDAFDQALALANALVGNRPDEAALEITVLGPDLHFPQETLVALGERRASAVRDYLVSLGIGTDRLLPVSRGEESPQCTEEAEACYMRNRRGHFVFTAK